MTIVAKCHARIVENSDLARKHMGEAHDVMNLCIEIENNYRAVYRAIRREVVPELDAVETRFEEIGDMNEGELGELLRQIRLQRQRARKRVAVGDAEEQQLKQLKEERKELARKRKELNEQFEAMLRPWTDEYEKRCTGAPDALIAQISEVGRQLKEAKKQKRNPDVPQLKRTLDELKKRKREGAPKTGAMNKRRASVLEEMLDESQWPEVAKRVALLKHRRGEALRAVTGSSCLYHGSYVAITGPNGALDKAIKTSKGEVRRQRWSGGRKVGIQIQGTVTLGDLFAGKYPNLRLRDITRNPQARRRVVEARLRIGTEGKTPTFVTATVLWHREWPSDTRVRWAYLVPDRDGMRVTYTLQLTLDAEQRGAARPHGTNGVAHVSLKWTKVPSESADDLAIVFAEVNGVPFSIAGDGEPRRRHLKKDPSTVVVGARYPGILRRLITADRLRSASDTIFDASREEFVRWMTENPDLVPDWMRKQTETIHSWRGHGRLARIVRLWAENEMSGIAPRRQELWRAWREHRDDLARQYPHNAAEAGDYYVRSMGTLAGWLETQGVTDPSQQAFIYLEWWRRKDEHLVQWSADERRAAIERRNYEMRILAIMMAEYFESVEVNDIEIPRIVRRKRTDESGEELNRAARFQRFCVAPGAFKALLKEAFGKGRYAEVNGERSGDSDSAGTARESEKSADPTIEHVAAE